MGGGRVGRAAPTLPGGHVLIGANHVYSTPGAALYACFSLFKTRGKFAA